MAGQSGSHKIDAVQIAIRQRTKRHRTLNKDDETHESPKHSKTKISVYRLAQNKNSVGLLLIRKP